jgi:general secretion pathway protein H
MHCGRRAVGFTLLELLVTLVIIGIVVSMATLSLSNDEARQVEQTGERLNALIELAKQEALFGAQEFGLVFWQNGYAFYRLENQQWAPVTNDREFRPRSVPAGIEIDLRLEGLDVELPRVLGERQRPQVFVFSSGEMTPFTAEIGTSDTKVTLTADALGNLAFAAPQL